MAQAQGLLLWSPNPIPCHIQIQSSHSHSHSHSQSLCFHRRRRRPFTNQTPLLSIAATLESPTTELSARERRKLRNERRESKMGQNWREEVETKLLKKPKKRYATWTEELNLDNLADIGPQWWVVRVSRARGQDTAELIARLLVRNFPQFPFKVYAPSVKVKRRLKNGSISIKPKPLFPGCVFLRCVLNKEIHDFIRECDGVGGFIGSKVGNTKRQINRPRPVDEIDMEAIFKQAKEEQEKHEKEFEEEQQREEALKSEESQSDTGDSANSPVDSKAKPQARKSTKKRTKLVPGSMVKVLSGNFAEFKGSLKKINRKTKKATVGVTLFGKESLVELDLTEIVAETE